MIKHHIDNDLLLEKKTTRSEICEQLLGGPDPQIVTVHKWNHIRDFEYAEGQKRGKAKEKVLTKGKMLSIANESD